MNPTSSSLDQRSPRLLVDTEICMIGGVVWRQHPTRPEKQPVAQAAVQLKDTAWATTTDRLGRFKFRKLKPGHYTLVVQTPTGEQTERPIQVPPDYDVILPDEPVATTVIATPSVELPAAGEEETPPPAPAAEEPAEEPPMVVQVAVQPKEEAAPKPKRSSRRKKGAATT